MQELLQTEATYVVILDVVVNLFLEPIQERGLMDDVQLKTVFSNIQMIRQLNTTLLSDLQQRVSTWSVHQKIGDIFLQIVCFDFITSCSKSTKRSDWWVAVRIPQNLY